MPLEPWAVVSLAADGYASYFEVLGEQSNLVDFAEWLAAFTISEEFLRGASQYIDLNRQLHGEVDLKSGVPRFGSFTQVYGKATPQSRAAI